MYIDMQNTILRSIYNSNFVCWALCMQNDTFLQFLLFEFYYLCLNLSNMNVCDTNIYAQIHIITSKTKYKYTMPWAAQLWK